MLKDDRKNEQIWSRAGFFFFFKALIMFSKLKNRKKAELNTREKGGAMHFKT